MHCNGRMESIYPKLWAMEAGRAREPVEWERMKRPSVVRREFGRHVLEYSAIWNKVKWIDDELGKV